MDKELEKEIQILIEKSKTIDENCTDYERVVLIIEITSILKKIGFYEMEEASLETEEASSISELNEAYRKLVAMKRDVRKSTFSPYVESIVDFEIDVNREYKDDMILAPKVSPPQKHTHIFSNDGFRLFEYLLKEHTPAKRGRTMTIHYYYHQLKKRKYLLVKHQPFLDWFNTTYQEKEEPIYDTKREADTKNTFRTDKHFTGLLELFKQHKNN